MSVFKWSYHDIALLPFRVAWDRAKQQERKEFNRESSFMTFEGRKREKESYRNPCEYCYSIIDHSKIPERNCRLASLILILLMQSMQSFRTVLLYYDKQWHPDYIVND